MSEESIRYAPRAQRAASAALFGALGAGAIAVAAVAAPEAGMGFAGTIAVAGFLSLAAAVRSWWLGIELTPEAVTVHAMFWKARYPWSQVVGFSDLRIRSGFDAVTSPFLYVRADDVPEVVMLPLMRPLWLGFESRSRKWQSPMADLEEYRVSLGYPPTGHPFEEIAPPGQ